VDVNRFGVGQKKYDRFEVRSVEIIVVFVSVVVVALWGVLQTTYTSQRIREPNTNSKIPTLSDSRVHNIKRRTDSLQALFCSPVGKISSISRRGILPFLTKDFVLDGHDRRILHHDRHKRVINLFPK
jgi:hypothetical protein